MHRSKCFLCILRSTGSAAESGMLDTHPSQFLTLCRSYRLNRASEQRYGEEFFDRAENSVSANVTAVEDRYQCFCDGSSQGLKPQLVKPRSCGSPSEFRGLKRAAKGMGCSKTLSRFRPRCASIRVSCNPSFKELLVSKKEDKKKKSHLLWPHPSVYYTGHNAPIQHSTYLQATNRISLLIQFRLPNHDIIKYVPRVP